MLKHFLRVFIRFILCHCLEKSLECFGSLSPNYTIFSSKFSIFLKVCQTFIHKLLIFTLSIKNPGKHYNFYSYGWNNHTHAFDLYVRSYSYNVLKSSFMSKHYVEPFAVVLAVFFLCYCHFVTDNWMTPLKLCTSIGFYGFMLIWLNLNII
jgi:hypothetical protein